MKKRKSKKIIIIILIILAVVIGCVLYVFGSGDLFYTAQSQDEDVVKESEISTIDTLEDNTLYVWHNTGSSTLVEDLATDVPTSKFYPCYMGDVPEDDTEINDIWFMDDTDCAIPTLYEGDELIYVSKLEPLTDMTLTKYADYGYSIGISNMEADSAGHYYINMYDSSADPVYQKSIAPRSDAMSITEIESVYKLYLDKVGDMPVDQTVVTEGGSISGLKKGSSYKCEFYTGTYFQDYKLTADARTFHRLESYMFSDYDFVHSNFIVINLPDYINSGYYSINGLGLFRYVSEADRAFYNGEAYSDLIDWNATIKQYDAEGNCIYDPAKPDETAQMIDSTEYVPNTTVSEDPNQLEKKVITWEYNNTNATRLSCFVICSEPIHNADPSVLTVTRPDGTQEEIDESDKTFVYTDEAAIEGVYQFSASNMDSRTIEVSYSTSNAQTER